MGKAANRKRDRKQAAMAATTQAIQKAQNGVMDDIVIVMPLMTSIETNNLLVFQAAVKSLEASGSDLFHVEIKMIDEDDKAIDMTLLHYSIYMGAEDIVAWMIRCGVHADHSESKLELQGILEVLNDGDDGTHDIAMYQRLAQKILRPNTVVEAEDMLKTAKAALQLPLAQKAGLMVLVQVATEFLECQRFPPNADIAANCFAVANVCRFKPSTSIPQRTVPP